MLIRNAGYAAVRSCAFFSTGEAAKRILRLSTCSRVNGGAASTAVFTSWAYLYVDTRARIGAHSDKSQGKRSLPLESDVNLRRVENLAPACRLNRDGR